MMALSSSSKGPALLPEHVDEFSLNFESAEKKYYTLFFDLSKHGSLLKNRMFYFDSQSKEFRRWSMIGEDVDDIKALNYGYLWPSISGPILHIIWYDKFEYKPNSFDAFIAIDQFDVRLAVKTSISAEASMGFEGSTSLNNMPISNKCHYVPIPKSIKIVP